MKETIKIIVNKYWRISTVILLSLVFFVSVSSYNYIFHEDDYVKWSSPDETANYIFSKLYAETGNLAIFEKYNLFANDIIHPRSFKSDNGELKPVSFLGIILIYGKIASVTSVKIIPYLTPFFASIGIIFFYLLIKKIFGPRNAYLSVFILASFPPFIYYTARSMFHNVLFIVMLLIGFYFCALGVDKINSSRKFWRTKLGLFLNELLSLLFVGIGGYFIGLGIISRTSELIWILPMLFVVWIINIRKIGVTKLIFFICFVALALLPIFYWNQILYLSPLNTGYPELNQSINNIATAGTSMVKSTVVGEFGYNKDLAIKIKDNFFHFGFEAKQSIRMFYFYFVDMFSIVFWLGFFGLFLFLQEIRKWKSKHFSFILSFFIFSVILIFYYGSWEFYDNPDKASYTIGNSYTRYWLPIYLCIFPLVSMFIVRLTNSIIPKYRSGQSDIFNVIDPRNGFKSILNKINLPRRKFLVSGARIVIIFLIIISSLFFVLFGSEEGLYYTSLKQKAIKIEYNKVIGLTESNSVIITLHHDKVFFPERKVIVGLFDNNEMNKKYANLVGMLPVYYYNFTLPETDIEYLNTKKLFEAGLSIEKVNQVTKDFSLYRLGLRD